MLMSVPPCPSRQLLLLLAQMIEVHFLLHKGLDKNKRFYQYNGYQQPHASTSLRPQSMVLLLSLLLSLSLSLLLSLLLSLPHCHQPALTRPLSHALFSCAFSHIPSNIPSLVYPLILSLSYPSYSRYFSRCHQNQSATHVFINPLTDLPTKLRILTYNSTHTLSHTHSDTSPHASSRYNSHQAATTIVYRSESMGNI